MFFNANEASVYRALLAFMFVAKILAGFPLFKQRGVNYPPTFVGPLFSPERSSLVHFPMPVHTLANDQQGKLPDGIPISVSYDKNRRNLYQKKEYYTKLLSGEKGWTIRLADGG